MSLLERLFRRTVNPISTLAGHRGRKVAVRGLVVPRDLIESPLSGARCVYYRYLVEEWRQATVAFPTTLGTGLWHVVERDEAICEFYVEDASGRALVVPEEAEVNIARDTRRVVEMVQGRRASEVRLLPGDLVEIRGVAGEIDDLLDDRRGYREDASRSLVRASKSSPLRIRLLGP